MGLILRRYAIPGAGIVVLLLFPTWALTGNPPPLPPKPIYSELPADALPVHVTFDKVFTLRGWRYQPYTRWWNAADNGWTKPDGVYTVELFWSVNTPVTDAIQFSISYVDENVRYGGLDRPAGTVSYPPKTTDLWQPGEIYSELVSLRIAPDAPLARSGRIMVGVYRLEGNSPDGAILPMPITDPAGLDSLTLQRLAIYDENSEAGKLSDSALIFGPDSGDRLALNDYGLPAPVKAGETASLKFSWQALTDLKRDYNIFIHVMDANNQLAAQGDAAVNDALLTSTWKPGYPVHSEIAVALPVQPGTYTVYIGLIDSVTGERLAVNAPDFRPMMGEIRVE